MTDGYGRSGPFPGGRVQNGVEFANMLPMGRSLPMTGAVASPAVPTYDTWSAHPYAGPYARGGGRADLTGTVSERVGTPYRGIGKTNVALPATGPPAQPAPYQGLAPQAGLMESMLRGLTEQFTGVLPGFIRDPLTGVAGTIGQALDVPINFLGHVPLPWVPDVQQAFDRLPATDQMARIRQIAVSDPDTGLRYMSQYLREHEQEYMAALQMPRILSPLMMPDANILERAMGVLGLPQQMIARTFAGSGLRDVNGTILNAPAGSLPAPLEQLRQRRLSGALTQDQFIDEVTQLGMAFTNDPFANFFLSVVTDPIIVGGITTGAALAAVERGSLALRTARALSIAEASDPLAYAGAVERATGRLSTTIRANAADIGVEEATQQAIEVAKSAKEAKLPRGREGQFNEMVRQEMGASHPQLLDQSMAKAEETLTRRQRAIVRSEPLIRGMAEGARILNEPFRVFGTDRMADMVGALRTDAHARGVFDTFGYGNLRAIAKASGVNIERLRQSGSWYLTHSERSLIHKRSLTRMIKDKGRMPEGMAERTPNQVIDESNLMAPDILVRESKRETARAMPTYVTDTSHISDPVAASRAQAEYRAEQEALAAERLVYATGMDRAAAVKLTKGASDKRLALAEALSFGRSIGDMVSARNLDSVALDDLIAKARAAGDTMELEKLTHQKEFIQRYTLIGARELTLQRAKRLLAQAEKGGPQAVAAIRQALDQYDTLNQNFEKLYDTDGRLIEDSVLLDRIAKFLSDGIHGTADDPNATSFPVELGYDELPANLQSFMDESKRVNGEDAYVMGVAPAKADQWRVSYNTDGTLNGVNPWVEMTSDQSPMFMPSNWDRIRSGLFAPIRGERLLFEARARFIREATSKHNISRRDSISLFEAVRKTASEREIQPRGLTPGEFRGVVDGVGDRVSPQLRQKLGDDGLGLLTARAFEGDIASMGVTSKVTGAMKTRSAGWGNWVGVVAEKVYPFVRFTANPIFQMQEWLEPYFFNIVRGVKPGMQWTPLDRATLALLDKWNLGTMFNDQAEYAYTVAEGWAATHLPSVSFGPTGHIAIVNAEKMKLRNVRDRKMLNYIRDTRADSGQRWKRFMLASSPQAYANLVTHYGTTDAGEIAVRFWIEKGIHNAEDPHYQTFLATGFIPQDMGKPARVLMHPLARTLGYTDPNALRKAITDGGLTEQQFRDHAVIKGMDPDFVNRAWRTAAFPKADEWFDEYAKLMRKAGNEAEHVDLSVRAMRAIAETAATVKGMGLDEFMASTFAGKPVWLDHANELPRHAYAQTMQEQIAGITAARPDLAPVYITPNQPLWDSTAQRLRSLLPVTDEEITTSRDVIDRVDAGEGFPPGDEVLLSVGTETVPVGPQSDTTALLDSIHNTVVELGRRNPVMDVTDTVNAFGAIAQMLAPHELSNILAHHMEGAKRVGLLPVQEGFSAWPDLSDPTKMPFNPYTFGTEYDQNALVDMLKNNFSGPDAGMFHMTGAPAGVAEKGLLSRDQLRAQGVTTETLGGGAADVAKNLVSVTYDPAHAELLQRRVRGAISAANGDLTLDDILNEFADSPTTYTDPGDMLSAVNRKLGLGLDQQTMDLADWPDVERILQQHLGVPDLTTPVPGKQAYELYRQLDLKLFNGNEPEQSYGAGILSDYANNVGRDPNDVRVVRVAVKQGAMGVSWVPEEHELRIRPQDIQTLGDIEHATGGARIQGTMQDMQAEMTARMMASYIVSLGDEGVSTGSVIQQVTDILDEIKRRQAADPTGDVNVGSIPLVQELVGRWATGVPGRLTTHQRDMLDVALSPFKEATRGAVGRTRLGSRGAAPIDIWGKRALGYWDPPYAEAIARRMVRTGEATDIEHALDQLSSQVGWDVRKDNPNRWDPEVEYEQALRTVNEMSDRANLEHWNGRDDWHPGSIAMYLSTHARRLAEQQVEELGTTVRKRTTAQVSAGGFKPAKEWTNPMPTEELTHQPGSTVVSSLPEWDSLPPEVQRQVNHAVSRMVIPTVEELTGVRFIDAPVDVVGARGGGVTAVSPFASWTIHGAPDAIEQALDTMGYLLQQDELFSTRWTDATIADSSRNIHWALDARVESKDPRVWDALTQYMAEAYPDAHRLVTARDTEGRQVSRSVWRPEGQATLDDFLAAMPEGEPGIEQALRDGTWVDELPDEFDDLRGEPVPVTIERQPVEVREVTNRGDGYPAGSSFEHQRGIARERVQREGISPEEAADGEHGRTYLDRIRARPGGEELARRLVGEHRDQTKSNIDSAFQAAAPDATGRAIGANRAASLGAGDQRVQYQRGPAGVRGAVSYTADTRSTLYVLNKVDASTGVHELAHVFARDLDESGRRVVMDAYDAERKAANPRARKTKVWNVRHEEYLARQFESYVAGGSKVAPTGALKAVFNAFGEWGRKNLEGGVREVPPPVKGIFDRWLTDHDPTEPKATFNVDEYRWLQALHQSFTQGEEGAHTRNYYKRGRSWTERSVNHPYLGMYPASYMWGKVLPAMVRFLVAKPFGIDAPFAGLEMAKHAAFYAQLMMQTNPDFQQFVQDHPDSVRLLSLLLPGTPWDIPVNMPAWARHMAEDSMQNELRVQQGLKPQPTDVGKIIEDTVNYAMGGGRSLATPFNILAEWNAQPKPQPNDAAPVWSAMGL